MNFVMNERGTWINMDHVVSFYYTENGVPFMVFAGEPEHTQISCEDFTRMEQFVKQKAQTLRD